MYRVYLFNEDGQYQAPIYLETDEAVVAAVFRYKNQVPRIMATKSDESVFEIEGGAIVFPEFDQETLDAIESRFEPLSQDLSVDELLDAYATRVEEYERSHGKNEEIYQSMVKIENDLFALAARDNQNLSALGWTNSGIIQARLEAQFDH